MRCHPGAGAAEPWRGPPGRRPKSPYPATPRQPPVASPSIASGSPWALRHCGELLKPPAGRGTSRLSAGGGNKERAPCGALSSLFDQFVIAKTGLPLASLISFVQVFSTSLTTLAGIGT